MNRYKDPKGKYSNNNYNNNHNNLNNNSNIIPPAIGYHANNIVINTQYSNSSNNNNNNNNNTASVINSFFPSYNQNTKNILPLVNPSSFLLNNIAVSPLYNIPPIPPYHFEMNPAAQNVNVANYTNSSSLFLSPYSFDSTISPQLHSLWLNSVAKDLESASLSRKLECDKNGIEILVQFKSSNNENTVSQEADFGNIHISQPEKVSIHTKIIDDLKHIEQIIDKVKLNDQRLELQADEESKLLQYDYGVTDSTQANAVEPLSPVPIQSKSWILYNFNTFPVCFTITFLHPCEQFVFRTIDNKIIEQTSHPRQTFQISPNSNCIITQECFQRLEVGMNLQYLLFNFHFPLQSIPNQPYSYTHTSALIVRRSLAININPLELSILSKESNSYFPINLRASLDSQADLEFFGKFPLFPTIKSESLVPIFPLPTHLLQYNMRRILFNEHKLFEDGWNQYYTQEIKQLQQTQKALNLSKEVCDFQFHLLKMFTAIQAEELQMFADIRQFDLFYVKLSCLNSESQHEFAILKVAGVSERRPALSIGDCINIWISEIKPSIRCLCYITKIFNDQVTVSFPTKELAAFLKISAATLFDKCLFNVRFTVNRQAIRYIYSAIKHCQSSYIQYLPLLFPSSNTDVSKAPTELPELKLYNTDINEQQKRAIQNIVYRSQNSNQHCYCILGCPGGGKTLCLVEAVLQVLAYPKRSKSRILICTPSNYSADILVERLAKFGLTKQQMIRLNSYQRHTALIPSIQSYCCFEEKSGLFAIPPLIDLLQYEVIVCTCAFSGILSEIGIKPGHFSAIFFDESAQALEPELYVPMTLANSNTLVVLVGDWKQLSASVHSPIAQKLGLGISLQERIMNLDLYKIDINNSHNAVQLQKNYRAHPALLRVSSDLFYDSTLESCANVEYVNSMTQWQELPNKNNFPLLFVGVAGVDVFEREQSSFYNPTEASVIARLIRTLLKDQSMNINTSDITVIAPYRLQVMKIRQLLRSVGLAAIAVDDVEALQGKEQRVIFISTTLSRQNAIKSPRNKPTDAGNMPMTLLQNPKRFNVALSRAKCLTVVVGNPYVLQHEYYWNSLIDYCLRNKSYKGITPPIQLQYLMNSANVLEAGSLLGKNRVPSHTSNNDLNSANNGEIAINNNSGEAKNNQVETVIDSDIYFDESQESNSVQQYESSWRLML